MRLTKNIKKKGKDSNGKIVAIFDILCDTESDLPAANQYSSDGFMICQGSRAYVIGSATRYMMQSDGTWTIQNASTAAYTKSEVDTLLAGKEDVLTFDTVPTAASTNPVTSGGILNWVYGSAPVQIPANSDLNEYYNIGTYRATSNAIAATLSHCPTQNGFRMEVVSTIAAVATGYQIQRLYPNNSNGEFFMRRRLSAGSGNWGDWYRFAGTLVSPLPADCPFTCDTAYFVDSALSITIGGTTYAKSNADYAIGMIICIQGSFGYGTGTIFMSPVSQNAVLFSPYHTTWNQYGDEKTVTFNGVTWYVSGQAGFEAGDYRASATGLPVYPNVISYSETSPLGISEPDILDLLAAADAANRTI